jgi:hypothetical protein
MASEKLEEGTLFPFALSPSVFLSFFMAERVLLEHFHSKCILLCSRENKQDEGTFEPIENGSC